MKKRMLNWLLVSSLALSTAIPTFAAEIDALPKSLNPQQQESSETIPTETQDQNNPLSDETNSIKPDSASVNEDSVPTTYTVATNLTHVTTDLSTSLEIPAGGECTLTLTPETFYEFSATDSPITIIMGNIDITKDSTLYTKTEGKDSAGNKTYTLSIKNVTGDLIIKAFARPKTYTVNYLVNGITYADTGEYGSSIPPYTGDITKPADASSQYTFKGWLSSADNKIYSNDSLKNLTITGDITYTAQYGAKHFLTNATVSTIANVTFTGDECRPGVSVIANGVTLQNNIDYSLTYQNNVNVGTATVTIIGKDNYTGTLQKTFSIVPKNIKNGDVIVSAIPKQNYTGSKIKPNVTITYNGKQLISGTDYTLSYKKNKEIGKAKVKITAKGNYSGKRNTTFTITVAKISSSQITNSKIGAQTYTGSAITPKPTVSFNDEKLTYGTDYTITYKDNIKCGKATLIIRGKGDYKGKVKRHFKIKQASIEDASLTSIGKQTYTGKEIRPTVKLVYMKKTLVNGTDYTLSYQNNINVGTATVTITGKGNFKDAFKTTFTIAKKETTTETYQTYKVNAPQGLYYRTGAGSNYPAKGGLANGTTVQVVVNGQKTVDGTVWYQIYLDGNYYYVAASYLIKA